MLWNIQKVQVQASAFTGTTNEGLIENRIALSLERSCMYDNRHRKIETEEIDSTHVIISLDANLIKHLYQLINSKQSPFKEETPIRETYVEHNANPPQSLALQKLRSIMQFVSF
jgi:shikimate kinase